MSVAQIFQQFLDNIKVERGDIISDRYKAITKCLNQFFRNSESETANSLQVGSYGRWTGIKGISDLDMLYIMPSSKWNDYKDNQYRLLADTKEALKQKYSSTNIKVDRLVVDIFFSDNTKFEVQPVFIDSQEDGKDVYKYPDTYNGGSWKITKPKHEQEEMSKSNGEKNDNLRKLCKMLRAWKNTQGVAMGGLLIDTLAYNYLNTTKYFDDKSFASYDLLSLNFFEYLKDQPKQEYYLALGSRQHVRVKYAFHSAAYAAYEASKSAYEEEETTKFQKKWKQLYGRYFPQVGKVAESRNYSATYQSTEEFIEDKFPVDIQYGLRIDCEVTQKGWQTIRLRELLKDSLRLRLGKSLRFYIASTDVPQPYRIIWKVRNRGRYAETHNKIRGQLIMANNHEHKETTDFNGLHYVECYIVKGGIVVARNRIDVPIDDLINNE